MALRVVLSAVGRALRSTSRDRVSCSWISTTTGSSMLTSEEMNGYNLGNGPSSMRGVVFWEPKRPLTIEDFHMPRPEAGEVLVKTKACGVCHTDLHLMNGELPFARPCVIGHEITGEVVEHGANSDSRTVKRFPLGARVVGAFIMPCGSCFHCVMGLENICETFFTYNRPKGVLYDGETRLFLQSNGKPVYMFSMGGLAEYCVIPATALAVLPDSLPYSESSILGCAAFTAYGAMRNAANMRAGETIAIIGVGGVGSSCIQVARAFGGSKIIAVDIKEDKLGNAKKLGATHTVNSLEVDAVQAIKEITGGRGVDISVEALGRPDTFNQAVMGLGSGGKAVIIGVGASGLKGNIDINDLVRRQIKIIGSYGGKARQDLPAIVSLAEAGMFDLKSAVSQKCKMEEAEEMYKSLGKGEIIGRAIVEI